MLIKYWIKYTLKSFAVILCVILIGFLALIGNFIVGGFFKVGVCNTLAPKVTKIGFLQIRHGMNLKQVIDLIGYPIYEFRSTLLDYEDTTDRNFIMVYAQPCLFGGLEATVFMKNGLVEGAGTEFYDLGIYGFNGKGFTIDSHRDYDALDMLDGCLFCFRNTYIGG